MIWDATCPDTLAQSYRAHATSATVAEEQKLEKYSCLAPSHTIVPVAIETLGAIGPQSLAFLKDLGVRIQQRTGEDIAGHYLLQQLSIAVQRGNYILIRDSMGGLSSHTFV